MKIVVLNDIDTPIYEQIYKQLSAQILSGAMRANEPLPSIRNIAKEVGISIITVKKAWELLEQNGLIYTQSGKGCFVKECASQNQSEIALNLARQELAKTFPYLKKLSITKEELIKIINQMY